jgi:hypothetical protein
MARVPFLAKARDFSSLHSDQTDSAAHSASYQMDNESSLPKGKVAGASS